MCIDKQTILLLFAVFSSRSFCCCFVLVLLITFCTAFFFFFFLLFQVINQQSTDGDEKQQGEILIWLLLFCWWLFPFQWYDLWIQSILVCVCVSTCWHQLWWLICFISFHLIPYSVTNKPWVCWCRLKLVDFVFLSSSDP